MFRFIIIQNVVQQQYLAEVKKVTLWSTIHVINDSSPDLEMFCTKLLGFDQSFYGVDCSSWKVMALWFSKLLYFPFPYSILVLYRRACKIHAMSIIPISSCRVQRSSYDLQMSINAFVVCEFMDILLREVNYRLPVTSRIYEGFLMLHSQWWPILCLCIVDAVSLCTVSLRYYRIIMNHRYLAT